MLLTTWTRKKIFQRKVLWSDEATIRLFDCSDKGTEEHGQLVGTEVEAFSFGAGFFFSARRTGALHKVAGTMEKEDNIIILQYNLKPSKPSIQFGVPNDPKCRSKGAVKWIQKPNIELNTSLDLNPFENMWTVLTRVCACKPINLIKLIKLYSIILI